MSRTQVRSISAKLQRRILVFEAAGFVVAAAACWVTEWFDPPFSVQQATLLSATILALGIVTTYWTSRMTRRIRYLEGFMVICAACKKVRLDDEWVSIEGFLKSAADLSLSHGMCPRCVEEYFGPEAERAPRS